MVVQRDFKNPNRCVKLNESRFATVELGSLDVSIQSIDGYAWEASAFSIAVRRLLVLVAVIVLVAGPVAVGGALGWMLTSEDGPVLGDDGWLRLRPAVTTSKVGFPLASSAEIDAAGLSVDEARKILRR